MMFSKLSRRERILLIILAIIGVVALYYYFLFLPMADKIALLEDERLFKENQVNQFLIIIGRIPQMEARYEELKPVRNKIANMVSTVDGLLHVLENASAKSGIEITSFIPDEREEYIQINMLADGSYEELILFLDDIDSLRGQIEFKKIIVARKNEGDDSLNINGTFIIHKDLFPGGDQR